MILVDTSIWIEYLQLDSKKHYKKLSSWIENDIVVISIVTKIELLAGASKRDKTKLKNHIDILQCIYPSKEDWDTIEIWSRKASESGEHFQISDLIIAQTAHKLSAPLFSRDSDFKRMEKFGWIQTIAGF